MLHIKGAVVVEGKYDKARLKNLVDCPVIVTNGFGVFNDSQTVKLLRFYAKNGGIIILTDSDSAGFKIRGYIKGIVADGKIRNAYVPDVFGKEKRKSAPSAEGKLGVEGISDDLIISALQACLDESDCETTNARRITRLDLYDDGLSGGRDSKALRSELLKRLSLPERLPSNSLLDALNSIITYDQYKVLIEKIRNGDKD